jgi:hypothetical protein
MHITRHHLPNTRHKHQELQHIAHTQFYTINAYMGDGLYYRWYILSATRGQPSGGKMAVWNLVGRLGKGSKVLLLVCVHVDDTA